MIWLRLERLEVSLWDKGMSRGWRGGESKEGSWIWASGIVAAYCVCVVSYHVWHKFRSV